ncbi:HNH endonuclease [Ralstonia pseudosolanacearum]|uniref:HNH endonuclease n=2 Tax=Ralstonia solanacearum species complex TaxID=3116862 RepID=A0AA92JYQ0_RALSL|nr:HNH endonuclease [Ralstonia pseudosolanacearum]
MMARTGRPETPLRIRFLAKFAIGAPGDCWLWTGATHPQGYGLIKRKDGAQLRAHRLAYELAYGVIPVGTFVCHRCDNPRCVRPDHLFLGSHADNMADMVAKGRAARMCGSRNGGARLQPDEVVAIRQAEGRHGDIAARFKISASAVGLIKRRERWPHL